MLKTRDKPIDGKPEGTRRPPRNLLTSIFTSY